MSVLGQDDFNRADNADLGAAWTPVITTFKIAGNVAKANDSTVDAVERYDSATWPTDQWSETVYSTITAGGTLGSAYGPIVRCDPGGADTFYRLVGNDAGYTLRKHVAGVSTLLASGAGTVFATGDTAYLEFRGSAPEMRKNSVVFGSPPTDSAIASGNGAIALSAAVNAADGIDSWRGGDFLTTVTPVSGDNGPGFVTGSPWSFTGEMATGAVEFVPGQTAENGPGFVTGSPYSFTGEAMTGAPEFVPGQQFGPGFVTGSPLSFTGEMATGVSDAAAASPNTVFAVAATVSYVGRVPKLQSQVQAPARSHTYTAQVPQVRTKVQPAQATHTYVGRAPALPTQVRPPARAHTYTAQVPQARTKVQPAQATHTYVAQVPQARVKVQPAQATHTYVARVPQVLSKVQPAQATHTYQGRVPTLPVSNAVSPAPATHTYTGRSPALQTKVQPPARTHTYTGQSPQLKSKVQPAQATHAYTARAPQARVNAQPGPTTHSYVGRSPQAKSRLQPAQATHTYTGRVPVVASGNIVFAARATHVYAGVVPTSILAIKPVLGTQARPAGDETDARPAQTGGTRSAGTEGSRPSQSGGARSGQVDGGRRRN